MLRSEFSSTDLTRALRRRAEVYNDAGRGTVEITRDELEELCLSFEYAALSNARNYAERQRSRGQVDERLMA